MSKNHKKGKHSQSNNRSKLTTRMEVEFGSEFVGDAKRAAQAVETRVKNQSFKRLWFIWKKIKIALLS